MHFSRNPPGPKISRIEALDAPVAFPLPAVGVSTSRSFESSSTGTYLRSAVFAACLALPAAPSLPALPFFFVSSPPSPCATYPESRYDNIPVASPHLLPLSPESRGAPHLDGSRPLALEQRSPFLDCRALIRRATFFLGDVCAFQMGGWQTQFNPPWGVEWAASKVFSSSPLFCSPRSL